MKRTFDLICSLIGLILLSPLFLLIAFAILLTSKGPIFFKQKRVGRNFKSFELVKFRSMRVCEDSGLDITAHGDSRITAIGKFIRHTKIDELPQLYNVLKGEMSLVGPRPEVAKYVELDPEGYQLILSVTPGITDWASIANISEELILAQSVHPEKTYVEVLLPQKKNLQRYYVQTQTFWSDLQIIFLTLWGLFNRGVADRIMSKVRENLSEASG